MTSEIDSAIIAGAPWQAKVVAKREKCASQIPSSWRLDASILGSLQEPLQDHANNVLDIPRRSGILSDEELDITEKYDVASLIAALASGRLSSLAVTTAFSKRAAIAQQVTNCLTETYFTDAEKRAKELDLMREAGQLAGPLHGLPISLKDSFQVAGSPATLGLVGYLDHISQTNSSLVDLLLSQGAVVYCKTNVPQTLMTTDSHNNVFGRTLNPLNTSLTAGGSSGGEGALVAMRGSPLGVGTDVGGSIRVPALCCGTYGFRPTTRRVPYGGQQYCNHPGLRLTGIVSCAGPLANDLDGLEVFMKSVINARPWLYDSTALDVPWRDVAAEFKDKKLRVGILAEDPTYPLLPPVRKAFSDAVKQIQAAGYETVALSVEECRLSYAVQVSEQLFGMDDTAQGIVTSAGEKMIPSAVRIHERWGGLGVSLAPGLPEDKMKRLFALNVMRKEIEDGWWSLWAKYGLDAVVAPSAQNTAVEHDEFGMPAYTLLLNFLDYPACVMPFEAADDSTAAEPFELKSDQCAPQYNPENTKGAPCSIQVFTPSLKDEECLQVARAIDACLNGSC